MTKEKILDNLVEMLKDKNLTISFGNTKISFYDADEIIEVINGAETYEFRYDSANVEDILNASTSEISAITTFHDGKSIWRIPVIAAHQIIISPLSVEDKCENLLNSATLISSELDEIDADFFLNPYDPNDFNDFQEQWIDDYGDEEKPRFDL